MLRRVLSFKGKAWGPQGKLCGWMGVGPTTDPIRNTHYGYAIRNTHPTPQPQYAIRIRNTQYAGYPTAPIRNTDTQYAIRSAPHRLNTQYGYAIRNTQGTPQLQYAIRIRNTQYAGPPTGHPKAPIRNAEYRIRNTQCWLQVLIHSHTDTQYGIRNTQCWLRVLTHIHTDTEYAIRSAQPPPQLPDLPSAHTIRNTQYATAPTDNTPQATLIRRMASQYAKANTLRKPYWTVLFALDHRVPALYGLFHLLTGIVK